MSQKKVAIIPDDYLFEHADSSVLNAGILLGRICQLEPTQQTEEALYTVLQNIIACSLLDKTHFTSKQALYREAITKAIELFCTDYKKTDSLIVVEAARMDYMRLLVGTGNPLAAPWESVYQSNERSMFQASTLDVRRWYHNYGMQSNYEYQEPDDHIGIMLEFICTVLKNHAQSALPRISNNEPECISVFIQNHFLSWINIWNTCIQQYATTSYYKALGWSIVLISVYLQNLIQVSKN